MISNGHLLHTDNLETILSLRVHEVLAADLQWGQCRSGAGQRTHRGEQTGVRLDDLVRLEPQHCI